VSAVHPEARNPVQDNSLSAPEPAKLSETQLTVLQVLLIILVTTLPFLPALRYGFVFDDDVQVTTNVAVRTSQSPARYFLTSVWTLRNSAIPLNYNYYRPLFHSWLRLNAALFGYNGLWWHLSAVLTHLLATVLVFFLIRYHFYNRWIATVGALIFGVHPAHIESVVWISGATDPLMAVGVLFSFLLWLKKIETPTAGLMIGSLASYAAALLCKETAIALPAIIFLYVLFGICRNQAAPEAIGRRIATAIRETLPFIGITVCYFGARLVVLHPFQAPSTHWVSRSRALLTAPAVLLFYLQHLVWPLRLRLFYDFPVSVSPRNVSFWGPLIVLGLAFAGTLLCTRRRSDGAILAALAWMAVPLLPVLNIGLFYRDDFVHDRYLYLPSIGLAILSSVIANAIAGEAPGPRRRLVAVTCVTLLIASLAALTATESAPWHDNLSLYSHAAQNSTNTMARINLASEYATRGRLEEAQQLLEPVVRERPDYWLANYNLGYVDYRLKNLDAAAQLLDRAIALNPGDGDARLYRGLICLRKNQFAEATALLQKAIALNPGGEGYHFALGVVLMQGNREGAKSEFRQELKYHPTNGLAKMQIDRMEKAPPTVRSSTKSTQSQKIN
jgi:protein O-mannosyl-transferase